MIQPFTPTTVMVAVLRIYPSVADAPAALRSASERIFLSMDAGSLSTAVAQGTLAGRARRFLEREGAGHLLRSDAKASRAVEKTRRDIRRELQERVPVLRSFSESLDEAALHVYETWHRNGRKRVVPESCFDDGMRAYHQEMKYCSFLQSLLRLSAGSV
ncbi:MAG TPA: hypothetical protein VFX30_01630 [bacterium]|nr:hypothetical protein [bacterium]